MSDRHHRTNPCLATVRVDRDFRESWDTVLRYWESQGIPARYVQCSRRAAFNCEAIGNDLVHPDQARRHEAQLAMTALFPYVVATLIKQHWHLPDDVPGREKAWDEVEEATRIIREIVTYVRSNNCKYDPAKGDVCTYLIYPRIGIWGQSALARRRFGRATADQMLAEWRAHPECGDANCLKCKNRYISAHSYDEDPSVFPAPGSMNLPPSSVGLRRMRGPGEVVLYDDLDPVTSRVIERDTYWSQLGAIGILTPDDVQLLNMRYKEEMRHKEIGAALGKTAVAANQAHSRLLSEIEASLSTCLLTQVVQFVRDGKDISFLDHGEFINQAMSYVLRDAARFIGKPVILTPWITLKRGAPSVVDTFFENLRFLNNVAGTVVHICIWPGQSSTDSPDSSPISKQFQRELLRRDPMPPPADLQCDYYKATLPPYPVSFFVHGRVARQLAAAFGLTPSYCPIQGKTPESVGYSTEYWLYCTEGYLFL
jgi:hypothetical protein